MGYLEFIPGKNDTVQLRWGAAPLPHRVFTFPSSEEGRVTFLGGQTGECLKNPSSTPLLVQIGSITATF